VLKSKLETKVDFTNIIEPSSMYVLIILQQEN
jgi:hypothetical protein